MKKKIFFFVTFLILLISSNLFSQEAAVQVAEIEGVKIKDNETVSGDVMSLFQIQKLIGGKRYTDKTGTHSGKEYTKALKELYKYIDRYPKRFDNAERLIRIILKRREKYSQLFDELVAYSNEHPEDKEGCGQRVDEMYLLEDEPPEEIRQLLLVFREMYLYKYYDNQFRVALQESSEKTHLYKYNEAVMALQQRFRIYELEFYSDWSVNKDIIQEADDLRESLEKKIEEYKELQPALNKDIETFLNIVKDGSYETVESNYAVVENDIKKLIQIQNEVSSYAARYEKLNQHLKSIDPDLTDASYIPFMRRFVTGISDFKDSGILGAINFEINDNLSKLKSSILGKTSGIVDKYNSILPDEILEDENYTAWTDKDNYVNPITEFAELGKKINDLDTLVQVWNGTNNQPEEVYKNSLDYISGLAEQSVELISIAEQLSVENEIQDGLLSYFEINKGNSSFDETENIRSLFESVDKMAKILGEKENLLIENQEWSKGYIENQQEKSDNTWIDLTTRYENYLEESFAKSEQAVVNVWEKITDTYKENADIYSDSMKEFIEYAEVFHNGFSESIDSDTYERIKNDPVALLEYAKTHNQPSTEDSESPKRYPELTLKMTEYIKEQSKLNKDSLTSAQSSFEEIVTTFADWKDKTEVTQMVDDSGKYINDKLNSISIQEKETLEKESSAQSDYDKAIQAHKNIDKLLEDAQRAFDEGNLDLAEELNDRAWKEEITSWDLIDMPKRAEIIERKYSALSDRINDANNNRIVYETRSLYNKARDEMNSEHYEEALNYINQAIELWAKTHKAEKNQEYEDLHELINTAVLLQNGRELSPADPLYAEMSQLLSQANIQYDNGERLIKENKKDEADVYLQGALENLEKIRKIYPLNQDVSYLKLKIAKLQMDPKEFAKNFDTRIKEAEAKANKKETQAEGYNDLLSLQKIDPSNKTLAQKIEKLEIKLGMKEKPVDNSAKNKAARLEKEAQALYDKGQYTQASNKINEAIRLDPTSRTAKALKDRIEIRKGAVKSSSSTGSSTTTKPAANTNTSGNNNVDSARYYQRALSYYNNGSYQSALKEIRKIQTSNPAYWSRKDVQTLYNNILRMLQ
ncbi:MAG: hypothetical protein MJ174_06705 [Treponema sp.]|nr:hypothetical protein [Treponema sp.]